MEQEKVRSIFENNPNYETYRTILTKIIDSDQAQKLANFASIEALVLNMKENKLEQVENYVKQIKKEIPLVYIPHYSLDVKPMDQAAQKNHFFRLKLSNFSSCQLLDAINSLPWIDTEDRQKWTKSYTYILRAEWEKSEKKLSRLSLEHIDSKYLLHYLKKDGCPKRLLENAVRFFEQYGVQKRFPAYNYVIEYAFKRYPWYAAQYLIKFALKVDKKLAQKKVALAIVKAYKMLHIVEHDEELIQRIMNNQQALELFSSYGLNLANPTNSENHFNCTNFNTLFNFRDTKDIKLEYIGRCYEALHQQYTPSDFRKLEMLVLDMQKLLRINTLLQSLMDSGLKSERINETGCKEIMAKLSSQPLFNPNSYPSLMRTLNVKTKNLREEGKKQVFYSLESLYNEKKYFSRSLGVGIYFSSLFSRLFFVGCKYYYTGKHSFSDFVPFATVMGLCGMWAVGLTAIIFYNYINENNNVSKKENTVEQISYIGGYMQGFAGQDVQKTGMQRKKCQEVTTQRKAISTAIRNLVFSQFALFCLDTVAKKYDINDFAIVLNAFISIPILSYYLGKLLHGNCENAKHNAEELFENFFQRGLAAGCDARIKGLKESEEPQEQIIAIKAEESNESLPQVKQGLFKTLFGVVVTSAKSFCSNLVQRLQKIKIRSTFARGYG